MYQEQKLSMKNIFFSKKKHTENYKKISDDVYKKNYGIIDKNSNKIKIIINDVSIPFGCEYFNSKAILNLKITPSKNNEHHNILAMLTQFEYEIMNNIKDEDVLNDIKNKEQYSVLKKMDDDSWLLRTHFNGNPEIYFMMGNKKMLLVTSDLKQKKANVELELGTLWITDNNYGIVWNARTIHIIK